VHLLVLRWRTICHQSWIELHCNSLDCSFFEVGHVHVNTDRQLSILSRQRNKRTCICSSAVATQCSQLAHDSHSTMQLLLLVSPAAVAVATSTACVGSMNGSCWALPLTQLPWPPIHLISKLLRRRFKCRTKSTCPLTKFIIHLLIVVEKVGTQSFGLKGRLQTNWLKGL
jgi:hypothetical protein